MRNCSFMPQPQCDFFCCSSAIFQHHNTPFLVNVSLYPKIDNFSDTGGTYCNLSFKRISLKKVRLILSIQLLMENGSLHQLPLIYNCQWVATRSTLAFKHCVTYFCTRSCLFNYPFVFDSQQGVLSVLHLYMQTVDLNLIHVCLKSKKCKSLCPLLASTKDLVRGKGLKHIRSESG